MNRKQLNLLFSVLLVFTLLLLGGCGPKKAVEPAEEHSISVETATAQPLNIDKYVTYTGRVKGSNEVLVVPKISSRVTAVYVQAGQRVGEGQVIASLDSSDLEVSMAQTRASLAAAQASKAANDIKVEAAERNYDRVQKLFEAGAASSRELEAAKDELDALHSGTIEANLAQIEANLSTLEHQLQNCQISSPIAGVVGRLDVAVGQIATPQAAVAVINPDGELQVELMISEADISYIPVGRQVNVSIDAIDSPAIAGTVKSVSTIASNTSRGYPVIIALPNPEGKIRSGMFAEVKLSTLHKEGVLGIPLVAVVPQEGENVVFIVNDENRAEKVLVKTGINDGNNVEITEGLSSGQQVITKGNTLVQEGGLLKLSDGGEDK